jgi:hypothetical protein
MEGGRLYGPSIMRSSVVRNEKTRLSFLGGFG